MRRNKPRKDRRGNEVVAALSLNCLTTTGSGRSSRDGDTTEGTRREFWAEICHNPDTGSWAGVLRLRLLSPRSGSSRGDYSH
jgi:hypothetical protein